MKLLHGSISPFVRKVNVTLHELGLSHLVQRIPSAVSATQPNPDVVRHNPIGKIPTLVLDDGSSLYDSTVICEYLASRAGDQRLFPGGAERWRALRLNATGDGLVQAGILARGELAREPGRRWDAIYTAQWAKVEKCLLQLESEATALATDPTIGEISVGCAIGWLDFRVKDFEWRSQHPRLANWFDRIRSRPSFEATMPTA